MQWHIMAMTGEIVKYSFIYKSASSPKQYVSGHMVTHTKQPQLPTNQIYAFRNYQPIKYFELHKIKTTTPKYHYEFWCRGPTQVNGSSSVFALFTHFKVYFARTMQLVRL